VAAPRSSTVDTTVSYLDLGVAVHQAARAFMAAGIEPGDRVAVWAPNIYEWVVAALGVHSAGAVLVPLNTRFKGTEAGDVLRRSRAKVLVTVAGFLDTDYVELLRSHLRTDDRRTAGSRPSRSRARDRAARRRGRGSRAMG
jgi:acyl-CoA synthetase (AMP-forming)/AMP-acid ligase II